MARDNDNKRTLRIKDLVELYGFPTQPELAFDGLQVNKDLYREVVVRLAQSYLDTVRLRLRQVGDDTFAVEPAEPGRWDDAAYWLGNAINQAAGEPVIGSAEGLLRHRTHRPHPDYRAAVLANLAEAGRAPRAFGLGEPGDALRKALEGAKEVLEVRRQMRGQAAA
jgi:hypothetical protein